MRFRKSFVNIGTTLCTVIKFNYSLPKDKVELYRRIRTEQNLKTVENILKETIEVKCPDKSILYFSRRNSRLANDELKVNLLSLNYNKFYIISQENEDFEFQVNNEIFNSSRINKELTVKDMENLSYTLAYEEYCKGNSIMAIDILTNNPRDKYLVKTTVNSFTVKERQACTDILFKSAHDRKIKISPRNWAKVRYMEGQLSENEVEKDMPCFIELLEVFEKNGDKFIPLHQDKYRRISRKITDHYNAFKRDESVKLTADFKHLVFNKDRLNISLKYEIPGFVTINPRQAKRAGLKTNIFKSKIYREQTLIKDGDTNVDRFQVLVSLKTLEYLKGTGIKDLFQQVEMHDYPYPEYALVDINASKLPVLNQNYASKGDNLDYILDTCYEQKLAECKLKVLKYFVEEKGKDWANENLPYTKEQFELLQFFGIESNGIYQGIDNKAEEDPLNEYECRIFEFSLKGFSTLPRVEDVLDKVNEGRKKLNRPESIMAEFINYLKGNHVDNCREELKKLKREQKSVIRRNTRILGQIKLAKALTGGWWEGLILDSRENYLYRKDGKTLIIKVVRKSINM